jgi:hypothetical protein
MLGMGNRTLRHRFAMLAARWQLCAGTLLAISVALGYGLGTALVVFRLMEGEREGGSFSPHAYGAELILYRYGEFDPSVFADRRDFLATIAGTWVMCLLAVLVASLAGLWAARHGERALIPMRLRNLPPMAMPEARTIWRRAVRVSVPRAGLLAIVGLALGFSGAWVGEGSASLAYQLRVEAAWRRGAPQTAAHPRPICGPFAWADGAWVMGGTWLAAALSAAIPARRRLMRTGELAARWCPSCGYPRPALSVPLAAPPAEGGSDGGGHRRCPECGTANA